VSTRCTVVMMMPVASAAPNPDRKFAERSTPDSTVELIDQSSDLLHRLVAVQLGFDHWTLSMTNFQLS